MALIKVENGIATREPIPQFLRNLDPESLLDLSWTDPQLGVQAAAWWPEESGDAELPPDSRFGGEILTLNKRRKVVIVTHEIVPLTTAEIEERNEALKAEMAPLVDAERNRRMNEPFDFEGVLYQAGPQDRENILGSSQLAFMAVVGGAAEGDFRWATPDEDFTWIALDNSRVPMDAPTVIDFGKAVAARHNRLINRGRDLKDANPIAADFEDDKWWA